MASDGGIRKRVLRCKSAYMRAAITGLVPHKLGNQHILATCLFVGSAEFVRLHVPPDIQTANKAEPYRASPLYTQRQCRAFRWGIQTSRGDRKGSRGGQIRERLDIKNPLLMTEHRT